MNEKIRFGQIDLFKFIAALLVITIHTDSLSTYSEFGNFILCRIIARLAVPFFFISSGYLISIRRTNNKIEDIKSIFKYINKILVIYITSIVIYIPINIYNGYLGKSVTVLSVLKDFLFDGTMYHLWYLPALIIGMVLVNLLLSRFTLNMTLIISIALYIVGLLGDSYYGIISNIDSMKYAYDKLFLLFDYTRNGLFFAPIFIVLGYRLSKLYSTYKEDKALKKDSCLFILFLILFSAETIVLEIYNIPKHDSMNIFLVPAIFYLFRLCLQCKNKQMKNLRKLSLYIYILHPMMIVVARVIGKITETSEVIISNSVINYFIVTSLSILISIVLINVNKLKRSKGYNNIN